MSAVCSEGNVLDSPIHLEITYPLFALLGGGGREGEGRGRGGAGEGRNTPMYMSITAQTAGSHSQHIFLVYDVHTYACVSTGNVHIRICTLCQMSVVSCTALSPHPSQPSLSHS